MAIDLGSFTYTNDSRFSSTVKGRPLPRALQASVSNRYVTGEVLEENPNASWFVFQGNNTESSIYNTDARAIPSLSFIANIKSTASYFYTFFRKGHPYWINGS